MALDGAVHTDGQDLVFQLVLAIGANATTITPVDTNTLTNPSAAATGVGARLSGMNYVAAEAQFVYVAGGGTVDVYIQTTLDGGLTWIDIMNFHFTTATLSKVSACTTAIAPAAQAFAPGEAALTANTIIQGVLGSRLRCKVVSAGTAYTGATTLTVTAVAKG